MTRLRSAHGKASVGGILMLVFIAFLIYEGFVFTPVIYAQYSFRDAIVEEAKFSRGKAAEVIQNALTKRAAELELPITYGQIKVVRQPTRTRIQVKYQLKVEWLPGKVYTWDVDELQESVLF
jgi:hypothetical protein